MVLFIDNFDSFSHNLIDYLEQAGVRCKLIRNDTRWDEHTLTGVKGIVISPGPGQPKNAGFLMGFLEKIPQQIPVLGICLGHQAIGVYFGGKLEKALKPMHGKVSSITLNQHYLFNDLPSEINVTRYHSLVLKELPDSFEEIAFSGDQENMGMSHKTLPYASVQFHPEAFLTEHGIQIIKNWVDYNKIVI